MERIAARLGPRTLVCNVIDLSLAPASAFIEPLLHVPLAAFHERATRIDDRIGVTCERHGFTLVGLFAFGRRESPRHPEYFSGDGFHPSAAGYRTWGALVAAAAAEAMR